MREPAECPEVAVDVLLRAAAGARPVVPDQRAWRVQRAQCVHIAAGGENVASREVEQVLYRHPSIADAAVFGIPDPRWGESVCAAVVLRPDSSATADEIIAFARQHLGGYKVPRRVELIAELPRNVAGKVLKRDLRTRYSVPAREVP